MAGTTSAYGKTQDFNKQLYDPTGQGAGLQHDFKVQLSDQAGKIAGASGRRAQSQQIKAFHELIWNNPNIPNELKSVLAGYAQYQPRERRGLVGRPMPSGDGGALKQAMGGNVKPPAGKKPKPKKQPKVVTEPAPAAPTVKNKPKAKKEQKDIPSKKQKNPGF